MLGVGEVVTTTLAVAVEEEPVVEAMVVVVRFQT